MNQGERKRKRHLLDLTFRISRQPLVEPAGLLIMDARLNNKVQDGTKKECPLSLLFSRWQTVKKKKEREKRKKKKTREAAALCKSSPADIRSVRPELPNLTDFPFFDLQIKTRGCTLYQKVFSSRENQTSTSRESNQLAAAAALQAGAQSWSWAKNVSPKRIRCCQIPVGKEIGENNQFSDILTAESLLKPGHDVTLWLRVPQISLGNIYEKCQGGRGWRVEISTSFIHLAFYSKLQPDVTGVWGSARVRLCETDGVNVCVRKWREVPCSWIKRHCKHAKKREKKEKERK